MNAGSIYVCCADSGKQERNELIHTELVPDKTLLHLHVGMIWIQVRQWLTGKKRLCKTFSQFLHNFSVHLVRKNTTQQGVIPGSKSY